MVQILESISNRSKQNMLCPIMQWVNLKINPSDLKISSIVLIQFSWVQRACYLNILAIKFQSFIWLQWAFFVLSEAKTATCEISITEGKQPFNAHTLCQQPWARFWTLISQGDDWAIAKIHSENQLSAHNPDFMVAWCDERK